MIFTVAYRKNDGILHEEVVEAADRSACIAMMKARSVIPIRVLEMVEKETSRNKRRIRSSWVGGRTIPLASSIAVAVFAAGVIWWMIKGAEVSRMNEAEARKKPVGFAREVTSVIGATRHTSSAIVASTSNGISKVSSVSPKDSAQTTNDEEAVANDISADDKNLIARTGTEQVIAWIFSCPVGNMPPPLPDLPDSEMSSMAVIIASKNPIVEGDSEEVAVAKETIAAVKDELKQYLAEGGSAKEFLKFYHGKLVEAHKKSLVAREELSKVAKDNPEIAAEFCSEVNKWLQANGVEGVDFTARERRVIEAVHPENNAR